MTPVAAVHNHNRTTRTGAEDHVNEKPAFCSNTVDISVERHYMHFVVYYYCSGWRRNPTRRAEVAAPASQVTRLSQQIYSVMASTTETKPPSFERVTIRNPEWAYANLQMSAPSLQCLCP